MSASHRLVLASASRSRQRLLAGAGVSFVVEPADIDEAAVKTGTVREGRGGGELAAILAEMKAVSVSHRHPEALVIGADQVLECAGVLFDKPGDIDAAAAMLRTLRGRRHRLISALAVAAGGALRWRHSDRATLTMRRFSDAFLEHYLRQAGKQVLQSVGAYQIEGPGIQLFERISGNYFTILGLPLLPLLALLRRERILPA